MADKETYRNLFNNAVEDIKTSKELSYAAIARLSKISKHKAANIRNGRSTPKIDDILKLLEAFPHFERHFQDLEEIKVIELKGGYATRQTLANFQKKLELCTKANGNYKETIAAQMEEIKHLKEIIAMQDHLLKDHGIDVSKPDQ